MMWRVVRGRYPHCATTTDDDVEFTHDASQRGESRVRARCEARDRGGDGRDDDDGDVGIGVEVRGRGTQRGVIVDGVSSVREQ